jgi:hypothetical protein
MRGASCKRSIESAASRSAWQRPPEPSHVLAFATTAIAFGATPGAARRTALPARRGRLPQTILLVDVDVSRSYGSMCCSTARFGRHMGQLDR